MWLWLHRLPGCGAPGAWLPSLCRGPGSRSALQVGRQVAGSSWLGPAVITKVPWTEPWVHLSTPLGSEAGRSHLLGAIWADRLRADGRNLTSPPKVKLGPLSAAPPCSLPNFPVGRALCLLSRASPRPQPPQILAGPRREGGVSPLLSSVQHLPGASLGPSSGQPHAGSGGGPASAAGLFAPCTPPRPPPRLSRPRSVLCRGPRVPAHMCLLVPGGLGSGLPPWGADSPGLGLLGW